MRVIDVSTLVAMLLSCYVAYGARCMQLGIRYWHAVIAGIVACIPLLSPWGLVGIPFGIWALVVLWQPDVRVAFADRTSTKD